MAFAKGGVYFNSFSSGFTSGAYYATLDDGLGEGMQLIVSGMHDSMGDLYFVPWGNNSFKFLDNPTSWTLDDGTVVPNPIGQGNPHEIKLRNTRAYGASNSMLPEWTYMYALNNVANVILSKVEGTIFSGDADTKRAVLKAWSYWWKGYAYSRIGSMYIAGPINDLPNITQGNYVTNTALIAEANANFDKAATILGGLTINADYTATVAAIMPGQSQIGSAYMNAGQPSPTEWIHSINTMKARNLLVNKKVSEMTGPDWNAVLASANAGVGSKEVAFVARSYADDTKGVVGKDDGTPGTYIAIGGSDANGTYFISERFVQDFRAGDQRLANNIGDLGPSTFVNIRGRGINFGTRWYLIDGGSGINGTLAYTHSSQTGTGVDDTYIGPSYEENQLIKAEALIQTGSIDAGVALIDGIRTFQGAGLAALGAGKTKAEALEELRSERRVALFGRGLAFYDARRNGVTDDISVGGGRKGCVVLSTDNAGATVINTNATINYNYLPYFDVPQNDTDFNTPTAGSASVATTN
jgi:hypothetical protein